MGQPAACMIENKGLSRSLSNSLSGLAMRYVGWCGRAIMADGARRPAGSSGPLVCRLRPGPGAAVDLSTEVVDKVVGNRWLRSTNPRKTSRLLALHKKSASFLMMEINHLRTRESSMTRAVPTLALRRAAVEFHTRAVAGVSRD